MATERIADTPTSTVYRATRRDGRVAALKILKPYGRDEMAGLPFLRWLDGAAAARVIESAQNSILLEWLDGPSLGDVVRDGDDAAGLAVLCDILRQWKMPRSAPPPLRPLRNQFEALLSTTPETWTTAQRPLVARAVQLAGELLDSAPPGVPLHGDFHHDNIMHGSRGWLAIDAKGLLGDPGYEVANVFRNPFGAADLALDPRRIRLVADVFSGCLSIDRTRILGWAAAHAGLSACWDRAAGNSPDFNFALLPKLLAARDA